VRSGGAQAAHPTEPLVLSHRLDRDTSGNM
jgi:23S rRNA-/tRNA-specific pseudouridylate synthase